MKAAPSYTAQLEALKPFMDTGERIDLAAAMVEVLAYVGLPKPSGGVYTQEQLVEGFAKGAIEGIGEEIITLVKARKGVNL